MQPELASKTSYQGFIRPATADHILIYVDLYVKFGWPNFVFF